MPGPAIAASPLISVAPDFEGSVLLALPEWWRQGQQAAWTSFQAAPFPSPKDEAWRFGTTSRVRLDGFCLRLPVPQTALEEIRSEITRHPDRFVIAHDQVLHRPQLDLPHGVIVCTLEEAVRHHGDLVQRHFMTQAFTLGSAKLAFLHRAHGLSGLFIYVPDNVQVAQPISVDYWLCHEAATILPHNLIVAGERSRAEVRVNYRSTAESKGGLNIAVCDTHAGAGSQLRTRFVQNLNEDALSFQLGATVVERDALASSLHVNLGASYARLENKSRMIGAGGKSEMFSLTASHRSQEFDQRTFQEHAAPNTVSDLLYKNALADESRTIFAGMIDVNPVAQQTNAYQSNRNLLLSPTAEANSLPGLEIMANDVRCTHGATTGQVSPEELFYMQQRGIPLSIARRLFVMGFFDEVLARLDDDSFASELHALIEHKFTQSHIL